MSLPGCLPPALVSRLLAARCLGRLLLQEVCESSDSQGEASASLLNHGCTVPLAIEITVTGSKYVDIFGGQGRARPTMEMF